MTTPFSVLPRAVVVLGIVSLLNDAASDMIAPLLPLFLTATLGAGPAVVGLIEGLAEAVSSILKLISGRLADKGWDRKNLVIAGYGASNIVRPLIGIATGWGMVLALRFLDRVGKGVRTAPRDAIIATAAPIEIRGRAFGFHRAMDHTGGMIGPLIAFVLLQSGMELGQVFLWSAVPGVLVLLLIMFGVPRTPPVAAPAAPRPPLRWSALDHRVQALVLGAGGLALATAPEAFLVLWASQGGVQLAWIPLLWAAAHAVKAVVATPAGMLSDHWGRLPVVVTGWTARIVMLAGFAFFGDGALTTWALFLVYAAIVAFTEGAERAMIGDLAPPEQKATAFGIYHLLAGIMALPGALMFGALWQWAGMASAFMTAGVLTALSAATLIYVGRRPMPR